MNTDRANHYRKVSARKLERMLLTGPSLIESTEG